MNIVDGTVIGSNMQCTAQSPDANSRAYETIVAAFHRESRAGTGPYDGTMIHVIERVFGVVPATRINSGVANMCAGRANPR